MHLPQMREGEPSRLGLRPQNVVPSGLSQCAILSPVRLRVGL